MERERNSECWYSTVCQLDNSCDTCIRYQEMKYLMDNSGLPKNRQKPIKLMPDDCDYEAFCDLQDFKNNIAEEVEFGNNLFIGGYNGNGKTSWAIKILLKYFNEIWPGNGFRTRGLFVSIPTLLLQLKDFNNPLSFQYKEDLITADLVVWDEIGGVSMSGYDYSQLLNVLDARILRGLSNIYTGNILSKQDCEKQLGEKLTSRVWNNSKIIILKGKDKRGYGVE